jgi:hypothetical protein
MLKDDIFSVQTRRVPLPIVLRSREIRVRLCTKCWKLCFTMFRIQSTPDFSVAEHYGLRNTTCLYSKDVASCLMHIRVGWFWTFFYIFNKSTPEICYTPSKSTKNSKKHFLDPVTASSLVLTFWVMHSIMVQNFLFTLWTSWVLKDAEFYVEFKNINLPLWQNAP